MVVSMYPSQRTKGAKMTDKELLQEALYALTYVGDKEIYSDTVDALRARLSQPEPAECDGGQCGIGGYCTQCPKTQPEQEPVGINEVILDSIRGSSEVVAPPQREWVGLTDDEIIRLRHLYDPTAHWSLDMFARAIEAKLKDKNK